jgi:hypothetical protein
MKKADNEVVLTVLARLINKTTIKSSFANPTKVLYHNVYV